MAYFRRPHFLLILEKALPFISDELDVFRMVSRYDNRRACIAPYNSKMQFEYTMDTSIQEISGTEQERECTERCNSMDTGGEETRLLGRDCCTVLSHFFICGHLEYALPP
jgi:hypothetical protein